jgi:tRNA-dihydrouridine synthase B
MNSTSLFSKNLQNKIDTFRQLHTPIQLGSVKFDSPLILAPMAGICNAPFRFLMQELGAGGTVSELVSCHGINYKNDRTLNMLRLYPGEKNVGLQLFGEDAQAMANAVKITEEFRPTFIDINMGCPVRKVVDKGGGSALLKDTKALAPYLKTIKKVMNVPLTIKIRMGWNQDQINADEIIKVAQGEGVEFVAIHGRTRAQQYTGVANWDYIEKIAIESPLPLIGNGDLHSKKLVRTRLEKTNCPALMLARGALRDPFIFLMSLKGSENINIEFDGSDYLEILKVLLNLNLNFFQEERVSQIQVKKHMVWFATGLPGAAKFRSVVFATHQLEDLMKIAEDYFLSLGNFKKQIDENEIFMTSGHG